MPKAKGMNKVLVIGSGPIVIGQAAEFDYAGTQACLALKAEGCQVVLLNNNPATVMTDEQMADTVYFEPLTTATVQDIIAKEEPDGLLATMGGQTGLNLAYDLHDQGILQKYGVKLLGTDIAGITGGEDRKAFRALMQELAEPVAASESVETMAEAQRFAAAAGYPLIVRPAYTLGGSGGGVAKDEATLAEFIHSGLAASPIGQCLLEESIAGHKEIEYEIIRDARGTCVTVCGMENIDPVGVHTGDSVVVAPTQTLTAEQEEHFHHVSHKIADALGIVGGCNVQFALDPDSGAYHLIEVNPRVSRSSALASKATGYPIAKVAAKLSLGYHLEELTDLAADHAPTVDYVVVKFPRWPFDKFATADRTLGTQMKATGEVMALADDFPCAFQKAVRSLELDVSGLQDGAIAQWPEADLWPEVSTPTDHRLFAVLELLRRGASIASIQQATQMDRFFLQQFAELIEIETEAKTMAFSAVNESALAKFKAYGFADAQLAQFWDTDAAAVRAKRQALGMRPHYQAVGQKTYFYSSWAAEGSPTVSGTADAKKKALVLGAGPIRIGQGIEFDYCSVHAVLALQAQGYETILINNNPETVSTDDTLADRLYFEPLALEDVLHVADSEGVDGIVTQVGGQTSISLVAGLEHAGYDVWGVSTTVIDELEDRGLFYQAMAKIGVPHIPGMIAADAQALLKKAEQIGYPVLLRPSYVIGGQGMVVLSSLTELQQYMDDALTAASYPILIDPYMPGTEAEVDVLTDGADIFIPGVMEHVDEAGVHSGDSTAVTPPFSLADAEVNQIVAYTKKIAQSLAFTGIFNIQFVIKDGHVYVLEVNARASRTVPIMSKITGVDMIGVATALMQGESLAAHGLEDGLLPAPPYVTVKKPVFSTAKLAGVDPELGPEMTSTGEVMAISQDQQSALQKADGHSHEQPRAIGDWLTRWEAETVPSSSKS